MIFIPELFSVISEELLSFDTHYITTEKTLSTSGKKNRPAAYLFLTDPRLPENKGLPPRRQICRSPLKKHDP